MIHELDGMTLHVGDVRAELRGMPRESVHTVVTSPPYWALRSYKVEPVVWNEGGGETTAAACLINGHDWGDEVIVEQPTNMNEDFNDRWGQGSGQRKQEDARPQAVSLGRTCSRCGAWLGHYGLEPTISMYVAHTVEVFREVRRVLRHDGTLWLNIGDCFNAYNGNRGTDSRYAGRREDKEPKFPGGHGLAEPTLKPKDLCMIPARVALALQADGWYLRRDIIWSKPNAMPESVRDRPSSAHEYVFLFSKSGRYYYDIEGAKVPAAPPQGGRQQAAMRGESDRVGTAKARSHDDIEVGRGGVWQERRGYQPAERRLRSVWEIPTAQYPHAHFATYPLELVEPCVKLGTSERGVCPRCGAPWRRLVEAREPELAANTWAPSGAAQYELAEGGMSTRTLADGSTLKHIRRVETVGWEPTCGCAGDIVNLFEPVPATVLDPFAGSGTTLAAARRLGRHAVGIELSPEYAASAVEHRLTRWWRDPPRPAPADEAQLALEVLT